MSYILLSGANDYFNIFEYYVNKFNQTTMTTNVWLQFTIMITIGFAIRAFLLVRFEKHKLSEEESNDANKVKNVYIYCAGHVAYEWIFGYIISYFVVKLSGSSDHLFMVNMFLAPSVGFILALLFDNKIIMKLEDSNNTASMKTPSKPSNIQSSQSPANDNHSLIINVNSNTSNGENITTDTVPNKKPGIQKISAEDATCDLDMAMKVIDTVNTVIDRDKFQEQEIEKIKQDITDLQDTIKQLKTSEMNDKKLELKSLIYKCLNNGFALPEENDVITTKYTSYRSLNGNHEIQALYENHYLHLGVHEDRRKQSRYVDNDQRRNNKVPYGIYDNEITVKEEKPLG